MKSILFLGTLLFSLIAVLPLYADEDTIKEPESEVEFKKVLKGSKDDINLRITGLGCREKFYANVYGIAHFMHDKGAQEKLASLKGVKIEDQKTEDQVKTCKTIVEAEIEKTLILAFVRDVEGHKIQEAFKESLLQTYNDKTGLSKNAETFIGYFAGGVKDKDRIVLKYVPEGEQGKLMVFVAGTKKDLLEDKKLAQAVWAIWFCKEPTVGTSLRDSLLSQLDNLWKN
jgi:predicted SnoaL-like aldol condensation-catalyzing enzyme